MKLDLYQTNLQNWFKLHLGLLLGTYNPEYWSVDYFHFLRYVHTNIRTSWA